jgi:hypothetical protein
VNTLDAKVKTSGSFRTFSEGNAGVPKLTTENVPESPDNSKTPCGLLHQTLNGPG